MSWIFLNARFISSIVASDALLAMPCQPAPEMSLAEAHALPASAAMLSACWWNFLAESRMATGSVMKLPMWFHFLLCRWIDGFSVFAGP